MILFIREICTGFIERYRHYIDFRIVFGWGVCCKVVFKIENLLNL